MRLPAEVTIISIIVWSVLLLAGVEADSGSWLSYTWGQAKHAGREAGNALYKGVKELACLQVRLYPGEYPRNQESCVRWSAAARAGGQLTAASWSSCWRGSWWGSTSPTSWSPGPCGATWPDTPTANLWS